MPTAPPPAAQRNYATSALIAQRTANQAMAARPQGIAAVYRAVLTGQVLNARTSAAAVADALVEQQINEKADALLNSAAFTTERDTFTAMVDDVTNDAEFARLIDSIVHDAARAAESVAITVRPRVGYVRVVSPPCCSRCAVLAGRVYRWSTGFRRHPGCKCSMSPCDLSTDPPQNPHDLVSNGLVTGLSQADRKALADGADLNRIVNVRSKKAGLLDAGQTLTRAGRPTPAGIYRAASADRDKALQLLSAAGYIR